MAVRPRTKLRKAVSRLKGRVVSLATTEAFPALRMERQFGPLSGCYNEWSLITDVYGDEQASSDELLMIALEAVGRTMSLPADFLESRVPTLAARTWPGEHYRLLPGLCETVKAHTVVEIGTAEGASALAMLRATSVERLDTFDIIPWHEFDTTVLVEADFRSGVLRQHTIDLLSDFDEVREQLASADLIFIDGPKDGKFEQLFLPKLFELEPLGQQLLVLDDIRLMTMIKLWRSLPPPKLDLTSFGHFSGTGLLLRNG